MNLKATGLIVRFCRFVPSPLRLHQLFSGERGLNGGRDGRIQCRSVSSVAEHNETSSKFHHRSLEALFGKVNFISIEFLTYIWKFLYIFLKLKYYFWSLNNTLAPYFSYLDFNKIMKFWFYSVELSFRKNQNKAEKNKFKLSKSIIPFLLPHNGEWKMFYYDLSTTGIKRLLQVSIK